MDLKEITTIFQQIEDRRKMDEAAKAETLAKVFEEYGETHLAKEIRSKGIPKNIYIHESHSGLIEAFRLVCKVIPTNNKWADPKTITMSWITSFHTSKIPKL